MSTPEAEAARFGDGVAEQLQPLRAEKLVVARCR